MDLHHSDLVAGLKCRICRDLLLATSATPATAVLRQLCCVGN
jgi:hypothetical protein